MRSFGSGTQVKLPGALPNAPNVYDFGTTYDDMYKDLLMKDKNLYPFEKIRKDIPYVCNIRSSPDICKQLFVSIFSTWEVSYVEFVLVIVFFIFHCRCFFDLVFLVSERQIQVMIKNTTVACSFLVLESDRQKRKRL